MKTATNVDEETGVEKDRYRSSKRRFQVGNLKAKQEKIVNIFLQEVLRMMQGDKGTEDLIRSWVRKEGQKFESGTREKLRRLHDKQ